MGNKKRKITVLHDTYQNTLGADGNAFPVRVKSVWQLRSLALSLRFHTLVFGTIKYLISGLLPRILALSLRFHTLVFGTIKCLISGLLPRF